MTPGRRQRKATFAWRRRFWIMNNAVDKQRKALGKGLSALIPPRSGGAAAAPALAYAPSPAPAAPTKLHIDVIQPNPVQPRVVFQAERLEELASSIRANGASHPCM